MASSVIHMCIAKKVNEKLNLDEKMILLGSIAPDISKHLKETKTRSHFLTDEKNIDIDRFLDKYKHKLTHPFIMGYFIHLYTDFLWDKYFVSEIVEKDAIKLLDGDKLERTPELYKKLIYNDYTNLNIKLIEEYNLNLEWFYDEIMIPDVYLDEIPVERLSIIVEQTKNIIENTKVNKAYIFDIENIKPFIEVSTNLIYLKILEIIS